MEAFDDNSMPDDRNTEKEKKRQKISVKVCFIMKSTMYYSVHQMSTNNPELRIYIFFRYLFDNSIALPYSLSMAEENNEKEKRDKNY